MTPAKVKKFRENLLALRASLGLPPNCSGAWTRSMRKSCPATQREGLAGSVYFIIGNEKQFSAMDADVQAREDRHVYKLYPRDYWLTANQAR